MVVDEQNDEQKLNDELVANDVDLIIHAAEGINDEQLEPAHVNEQEPARQKRKSSHRHRSKEARAARNSKRNIVHRKHRYDYHITRPMYDQAKLPVVREMLDQRGVNYVHVKEVEGLLWIGVKNEMDKRTYQREIPQDMFQYENYERYRRQHRRRFKPRHK